MGILTLTDSLRVCSGVLSTCPYHVYVTLIVVGRNCWVEPFASRKFQTRIEYLSACWKYLCERRLNPKPAIYTSKFKTIHCYDKVSRWIINMTNHIIRILTHIFFHLNLCSNLVKIIVAKEHNIILNIKYIISIEKM